MSDTANTPNPESLESLVEQYVQGVDNPESGNPSTWLQARSAIENRFSELSAEQTEQVEGADAALTENAGEVAAKLAASGSPLRELRNTTSRPPEEWWWYLDVISHVSDNLEGTTKPPTSLLSRLLDIAILVVLGIAVVILAPNIPNLIQRYFPQATVTATAFPSWTPAPSATVDPASMDFASAQPYKSKDNIIEIKVPKGWTTPKEEGAQGKSYRFTFGDEFNPSASLQVIIDEPSLLYQQLGVEGNPDTPEAALEAVKKSALSRNQQFKFSDVKTAKIGNLDGASVTVSVPGNEQTPGQEYDLRLSKIQQGQMVFLSVQGESSKWAQLQPLLNQMADSLTINMTAIPTPTPSNTPHPLELTATFYQSNLQTLQAQILALTPTATPVVPTAEGATAPATEAATSPATTPEASTTATATP